MKDFDWLGELITALPKEEPEPSNFLQLTGYGNRELLVSNLLIYYLNSKADHQLGDLFLRTLLLALSNKHEDISLAFGDQHKLSLVREKYTSRGKRIDIVITGRETERIEGHYNWAIIIENKVEDKGALDTIDNELNDYWNSVHADHKIGIVLSLFPIGQQTEFPLSDGNCFYHLQHQKWVESIENELEFIKDDLPTRSTILLQEYINHILSFYPIPNMNQDEKLKIMQKYHSQITEVKRISDEGLKYVTKSLEKVGKRNGWKINRTKAHQENFLHPINEFFINKNYSPKGLKFWLNMEELRDKNRLYGTLELDGEENTIHGESIKVLIRNWYGDNIIHEDRGKIGGSFYVIFKLVIPIGEYLESGFEQQLEKRLREAFLDHPHQYVQKISKRLSELKAAE